MCCCSICCNPHLSAFIHSSILQLPFVPHKPPCVIFFLCTGDAASPKAAFGVVKERLGIWEEHLKHHMDVYKMVMLAASLGRSTPKEHLLFYSCERRPNWAVLVCCRLPGIPDLMLELMLNYEHSTELHLLKTLMEEEVLFRYLLESEQLQAVHIVPSVLFCFTARNLASVHGREMLNTADLVML